MLTFKREICRKCGCTNNNPCYHPKYGFCWWEDSKHTICSHCAKKEIKNSKLTQHRVNDIPDWQPPEETEEYCYNNCTVCTNECEFSRKENG